MKSWIWKIAVVVLVLLGIYAYWAWTEIGDYPDKLWLHRCNSIEKMEEMAERYDNIEVDLIYRGNGIFDVTHDADTTFGLHIDPFFDDLGDTDEHMWLDIKNITMDNCEEIHEDLDSLCEKFDVEKDQLIVESNDWKALKELTDDDYYTSFYVSFDKPNRLTDEEIDECIDSLQFVADSKCVSALSFPGWWYDDIKEDLNRPIDLLTWKHRTTQWEFMLMPYHFEMLNDPQLKVILMKDKGHYHR